MKYLEEMQKKKVFNLSFAEQLTGNTLTAKSLLQSYKKAGYITSIRRNLYAALDLASKNVIANRFEIASAISDSAFVSLHSALEYHGIANQVFYTVYVTAEERFNTFTFDGITYEPNKPKIFSGIVTPYQTPLVSVSDIERTIIDCIYDIDRAGGIEELLESLQLVPTIDEEKLLAYLKEYNQIFLWQKTGYIMERFRDTFHLNDDFFTVCKDHISNRKRYFLEGGKLVYYPQWSLYAPDDLMNVLSKGDDTLV